MFSKYTTTGVVDAVSSTLNSTVSTTVSTTRWLFSQFTTVTTSSPIKQIQVKVEATADFAPKKHPLQPEGELNLPRMAQQFNEFEVHKKNDVRCFHQVFSVTKGLKKYFYKKNPENSPMSELEGYCRASIDVIGHGHFPPSAVPVYDDHGQFVGICSEAIPEFRSIMDVPFETRDFKVDVLDKKILTIQQMKKLDAWARAHHLNLHQMVKEKSISESEWIDIDEADEIAHKETVNLIQSAIKQEAWFKSAGLDASDPGEIYKIIQYVAQDLINFRYKKGFGVVLPARYIHAEDDGHRGNSGRGEMQDGTVDVFGIDLDMLEWPILYAHKDSGIIDKFTRNPSSKSSFFRSPIGRFIFTANDISRLPHTKDACPFYKPTEGVPMLPEWAKLLVRSLLGDWALEYLSNNAFRPEDNEVFATLIDDPVFIHFKFKTFLKYILTEPSLYEDLAHLYVRDDVMHEGRKISSAVKSHETERLRTIRDELYKMGYDLELTYTIAPEEHEIKSTQLYLYLDAYGVITIKAKNSQGRIETMALTQKELGDHYETIKATLVDADKPALCENDRDALASATARLGYAQKNTMYEFRQFLRECGKEVQQEILTEFKEINQEYGKELINLTRVKEECEKLIMFADTDYIVNTKIDATALQKALSSKVDPVDEVEYQRAMKLDRMF